MRSSGIGNGGLAVIGLVVMALLAGIAVVILWRPPASMPAPPQSPDRVLAHEAEQPAASPHDVQAGFIGVVLARESVEIGSPQEGRLARVFVNLGDYVTRDTTLAVLDASPFKQELAMAEAALHAAQAEQRRAESKLGEARKHLAQVSSLGEFVARADQAAAELEVELAVLDLESSRARVDKEIAGVERLRQTLASTEVRAPFDGTVAARYQDPGTMLRSGSPIVRLIRSGDLWVRFAVPEGQLLGIAPGTRVVVDLESLASAVPAVVEQIAPEVDPASRMVVVEARLGIPARLKEKIQSGLACRVSLAGRAPRDAGGA